MIGSSGFVSTLKSIVGPRCWHQSGYMSAILEAIGGTYGEPLQLLARGVGYALAFVVAHCALRPLVRWTAIEPKNRGDWINRIIASTHALVVGLPCGIALFTEPPFNSMTSTIFALQSQVDTVHGDSATLRALLPLTLGYFLYDCCIMAIDPEVYLPLMVAHHLISVAVWPISFLSKRGMYYIIYFMATELSTPLLHLTVFFFPKHGLSDSSIFLPIAVGLLLVFFLIRVVPIPFVFLAMKATWGFWEPADQTIFLIWLVTIPVPPLLNSYWFYKLIMGALKKLGPSDAEQKKVE